MAQVCGSRRPISPAHRQFKHAQEDLARGKSACQCSCSPSDFLTEPAESRCFATEGVNLKQLIFAVTNSLSCTGHE